MLAAVALLIAAVIATFGGLLERVARTTRLDAVVITAVLAEVVKKLLYIGSGVPDKRFSLVLAAPLLLTAFWWLGRPRRGRGRLRLWPAVGWLGLWLGVLAFSTLLNPEGSLLVLAAYLVAWLWIPSAAGFLGEAGRWTYRILWMAVAVAFINQVLGPDPLWRAYRAVAEPVSIGARYTADRGYTGSVFSSPAELGAFILAASAVLAGSGLRRRSVIILSLAGAVLTGGRYVMLAVALFWLALAWGRLMRIRPWQAVAGVLAYSPLQDALGRRLLESSPDLAFSSVPFVRRLFTVGTLEARVGFTESWSSVFSQHWLVGIGLADVFTPTAVYPDDRHNLILWLVLRGGIVALVAYFAFAWLHFRRFARARAAGRVGTAFLLAALVMSMGGPQASSSWFFLALGALFAKAEAGVATAAGQALQGPALRSPRMPALRRVGS